MRRFKRAVIYFSVAFLVGFIAMSMLALGGINPEEAMKNIVYTPTQFWGCVLAVAIGFGIIGWCKRA